MPRQQLLISDNSVVPLEARHFQTASMTKCSEHLSPSLPTLGEKFNIPWKTQGTVNLTKQSAMALALSSLLTIDDLASL
ncbi:MAG: hypothetical protein V3V44_04980 [Anaerolineales bacterium]